MSVASSGAAIARSTAVVRFDRLLALYFIVPACFVAVLLDALVFHGALRRALPSHPDDIAFFTVLFNGPHIIASHLIFIDREYLAHYRKNLIGFGVVLTLVSIAVFGYSFRLGFFLSLLFTFWHIITQQVGLTGAQLRNSSPTFQAWKWMAIAMGVGAYVMTIGRGVPGFEVRTPFGWIAAALAIPSTIAAILLHRRAPNAGARRYLWANQWMLLGMLAFSVTRYPFFAILMPRVVHDLTAFYVYLVHDHNRSADGPRRNLVYRAAASLGMPTWVFGPLLAIAIAYFVDRVLSRHGVFVVIYVLSAFHYYMEGVVWKRGTPHRVYVAFQ